MVNDPNNNSTIDTLEIIGTHLSGNPGGIISATGDMIDFDLGDPVSPRPMMDRT
ncbi:MAG: hypothetical protein KJ755_11605 [Alphaproteobacteria bacterium]|uniref:hypothetical protein n=1 Tax=Salipiger marinus TaxID=555512 RepID=UPI001E54C34F|nr:hypothetical protein [Salipiger manganoxidans]MBU2327982.1 hypothetical protein [Alphaproteobacteria bacterium]MCD1621008.1 hypothetical protein [Salipiger manganoxidans]